jgi:hypothetical protein
MATFTHTYPLPLQLGSWTLVHPPPDLTLQICSMLAPPSNRPPPPTGSGGPVLPPPMAKTPTSPLSSPALTAVTPVPWTDNNCSYPLLDHCGRVSSTLESDLKARSSRARFTRVHQPWSPPAM